jgi:hypothetical protein
VLERAIKIKTSPEQQNNIIANVNEVAKKNVINIQSEHLLHFSD